MRSRFPVVLAVLSGLCAVAAGPEAFGRLALATGLPGVAAGLLADPEAKGAALYLAGDYAGADAAFVKTGRSATYNRGNTLAALGEYALAVDYFEAVLFADPADVDARFNRDLVARLVPDVVGDSNAIDGIAANIQAEDIRSRLHQARRAQKSDPVRTGLGHGPARRQGRRGQRGLAGDVDRRARALSQTPDSGRTPASAGSWPRQPAGGHRVVARRLPAILWLIVVATLAAHRPGFAAPIVSERDASLSIEIDTAGASPYTGEMVLVTVRGLYDVTIALEVFQMPDLPNFGWIQLGRDVWSKTRIGGREMTQFERRLALIPNAPAI